MQKPIIAGILIASLAFAGGMWVGERQNPEPRTAETTNTRTRAASTRHTVRDGSSDATGPTRLAGSDGFISSAKTVIRIGPQAERLRRILGVLDGLSAENWEDLLKTMADETSENGRFQSQEWDMALRRIGMIDGANAAKHYAAKGDDETLRKVLAGWAQADPQAAWKWMESYKDAGGRRDVWRGVLIGIAELNPSEAMAKLDSLPFEVKGGTISFLISPMIQAEGIDATAERIKAIYADYSKKDPATISAKEREYVYAFFHNVCDIKRNAGYTPEKRMEALELLSGFPDLAARSPWLIPRTVSAAANDDPAKTMAVVERMTVSNGGLTTAEGVDAVVKIWQAKDPEGLSEWVDQHRGTPQGDRAAVLIEGNGG